MVKRKIRRIVLTALVLLAAAQFLMAGGGQQAGGSVAVPEGMALTGYPIVKDKITVQSAITSVVKLDQPRVLWTKLEELTNIHTDFFMVETAQLAAYLAAGNFPDFFHNNLPAVYINDYGILGNRFVDYNSILQYMPNMAQCFKDYPIAKKKMTETNGAVYQTPTFNLEVTGSWARFYYRKDIMAKYNLPVPGTLDEFYNTLVTLKNAMGTAPWVMDMGYIEMWFFPSFGNFIDPGFDSDSNGKVVFNRTSDQYRRFLTYLNKMYKEGLLHNEFLTLDGTARLALVKSGSVVFCGNEIQNTAITDFPSGNWDIGVPKPFTSQWNSATKVKRNPSETAGGFAISSRSKYVAQIARMLDIGWATKEVSPGTGLYGDAFCYGPENLTWKFTNPQKTEFTFIVPPQVNVPPTVYQYDYVIYTNQGMPRALTNAVTSEKSNNQTRQLEFLANLNPNTTDTFFPISFIKFTDDEQAIIDNKYTDINTYMTEMRAKFITGVANIDTEWDNYVRTINNMGIADVIKVHQAAFDRWNAK
ncbi:MAG: extracellular solute-binding protein [Treponema sp.]|nr:extracellular solute-binding protein [Treponema sp.]